MVANRSTLRPMIGYMVCVRVHIEATNSLQGYWIFWKTGSQLSDFM